MRTTDTSKCIHCHLCQKQCSFLSEYKLDLADTDQLNELAYHCFLCGKCTEVCPVGIDGKQLIQEMRNEAVQKNGGKPAEPGYGALLAEKKNYLFRSYRHASSGSVFFPGCNFPSFYPKTTNDLAKLLKEEAGIGVIYDCCGKPVVELGMEAQEKTIIAGLESRFEKMGVNELVIACPNCYGFLKPRLSIHVVTIYEKLTELNLGHKIPGGIPVFVPCPDRVEKKWLRDIEVFFESPCPEVQKVQCCGLGGCASGKEPELSRGFADQIHEQVGNTLYTYCASCTGKLRRGGIADANHVLPKILGVKEEPDTGRSLFNRMKTKFL